MIQYEKAPATPAYPAGDGASAMFGRPAGGGTIETDPLQIIATAMLELAAQGRTVDEAALIERTGLTRAEIRAHGEDAADIARLRARDYDPYAAAAEAARLQAGLAQNARPLP